ncbi:MAG TPA: TonB-dependent receptor [Vicinamibacteria bacterium]|nr:TonB-dependent receptor [Vicinamibacteria bacterium]
MGIASSLRRRLPAGLLFASASLALAQEGSGVSGTVKDPTGAVVPRASVGLFSPQGAIAASGRTDPEGRFRFPSLPAGTFVLVAEARGFAPRRIPLYVGSGGLDIVITLQPEAFHDEVTVTASPGRAEALESVPQRVNVIGEEEIGFRSKAVLAQAASEEVGLHVQRTSPTMGGVFVRGLTGAKVNMYVDGVRYTTAAQRGGVSTFFNLVDPEILEGIEVVRGPSSAEYGSDALGGTVQLLTRRPQFDPSGRNVSGLWNANFGSADASYGSSLTARYAAPTVGVSGTLAARRANDLRPGEGEDSHNAVTRFFDLPSTVAIGARLPDTAFTQYGGHLKVNWAVTPTAQIIASYLRGQQDGGKRYDQLLGGDGNLVADLRNLMADHFHARFERSQLGFLDRLSVSYSFSAQREERRNQGGNGNPLAAINHEPERTTAHGVQAALRTLRGRHDLTLGADVFVESMKAPSFGTNPTTGGTSPRRGRVPDGASYAHGGIFLQDVLEAVPGKLRLNGAVRFSGASYEAHAADSPLVAGEPLWPDDAYDTSAFTFRAGALFTAGGGFSVAGNVSRGFRAPDVTDLGTFGLTGAGFEVSNREVEGLGAAVGTTADAAAVSTGDPVRVLEPETSLNVELTLRYKTPRFKADLTAFQNDIDANVAKQAMILPQGAVGQSLAGEPIIRQLPSGVVFVAASSNPVLVRANFDEARLRGLEATFDAELHPSWFAGGIFTYLHAADRASGAPPNIEGGTPAPEAWFKVRFAPHGGRRFWVEPYLRVAGEQDRLSSLDLADRRTGASRSLSSIASFFNNGARARGLVGSGPDGIAGTADDVLLATGETLSQMQTRVLGPSGTSSSLFTAVPSYVVLGLRGAVRFAQRHEVFVDFENIGDENYRGVSWGMDAPGRALHVRYSLRF